MDWPRENVRINEKDLEKVYKYEPKPCSVVRMLNTDEKPVRATLKTDEDWETWFRNDLPSIHSEESGLVLILARRTGQSAASACHRQTTDGIISNVFQGKTRISKSGRAISFPDENEKIAHSNSGQRSVRTLPFSKETFREISKRLFIHGSISRVVSRADVPVFMRAEVDMEDFSYDLPATAEVCPHLMHTAFIYNARTSNNWAMDLALAVTHFPHKGLTFAVLFGCPIVLEEDIVRRLSFATNEASHPLLVPGILAEIERNRHIELVESTINDIELQLFNLDFQQPIEEQMLDRPTEGAEKDKDVRSNWLDTTFLRNNLMSWKTQLLKMAEHADELLEPPDRDGFRGKDFSQGSRKMAKTSFKIKDRILSIVEEYEDKIRECTIRVDGMAMATQWAQGSTNLDIALATNKDSRHMRSIALVTMIFLPGTFFASVFSMTFFNWLPPDPNTSVSGYIWIYVLVTAVFTLLTIGSWWYFVIYKPRLRKPKSDEEIILL